MIPVSPRNLLQHELIGLDAMVVDSTNICSIGISGRIIDETRNTLVISKMGSKKIIPKETSLFRFTLPGGIQVEVDGVRIIGGPENRIKGRKGVE